jgi:hypothetical protein
MLDLYLESLFTSSASTCCHTVLPPATAAFENHHQEVEPLFPKDGHLDACYLSRFFETESAHVDLEFTL